MKAFWSDPALRRRISPLRIVQNPDVDFFFRIFGIAVEKRTDEHFIVPAKSGVLKKAQKKLIGDGIDPVVLVITVPPKNRSNRRSDRTDRE